MIAESKNVDPIDDRLAEAGAAFLSLMHAKARGFLDEAAKAEAALRASGFMVREAPHASHGVELDRAPDPPEPVDVEAIRRDVAERERQRIRSIIESATARGIDASDPVVRQAIHDGWTFNRAYRAFEAERVKREAALSYRETVLQIYAMGERLGTPRELVSRAVREGWSIERAEVAFERERMKENA